MADQAYFEYVAQGGDSVRRATIQATDERMVRAVLREQGLVPLEIKRAKLKINEEGVTVTPDGVVVRQKKLTFFYVGIPLDGGDNVQGEIIAATDREARQQLRERGLIPSKVEPKRLWHDLAAAGKVKSPQTIREEAIKTGGKPNTLGAKLYLFFNPKVSLQDTLFYASQMSTMQEAGLSFSQTMEILAGLITNQRLRIIHEVVRYRIMEGIPLAEAYMTFATELPSIFTELIAVGEVSGNLEQTLQRMVLHLEKQLELRNKIRGAMTYPLVMILLICLIVAGLMIFVVPTFIALFDSFKVDLPITTKALLAISWFVTHRWYLIPLIPGGIIGGWKAMMATKRGRQMYDLIEYRIPLMGKLIHKITVSRILHNLSLFLNCGITILNAIDLTQQSITNAYTSLKLESIRIGVSQGARMSSLFEGTGLFPPMVNYLLIAGEESGSIDELLEKGAKFVDQEIEATIKGLTSAIEPILTFVVAGIVMFIVGSLYLPLVGLMKGGPGGGG